MSYNNGVAVLRYIQHGLPAEAAALLDPVAGIAARTPACSGNILELHLNRPGSALDFAARLNVTFDKGILERRFPFVDQLVEPLMNRDAPGFRYGIENAWMEYDAPFDNAPALFFDIDRGRPFAPATVCACLERILPAYGRPVGEEVLPFLYRVKQAGLEIVYYGLMFSRPSHALRLTIHGIRAGQLEHTLKELGWEGNYPALQRLRDTWLHDGQRLVVAIDLGRAPERRIGIEVFDDERKGFIQRLFQREPVDAGQMTLLQSWEGQLRLPPDVGPVLSRLHQRPVTWLCTRINHFKFVIDDTDDIAVKGYLYYCF
jgi:hypothetical protein